MTEARKALYAYLIMILSLVCLIEVGLELRHFHKGYNTPIFGVKERKEYKPEPVASGQLAYGPTEPFPFRSIIVDRDNDYAERIWIASSSHAEGGSIPAPKIFPNLICGSIKYLPQCEVINGSKVGMTVAQNLSLMREYAPIYKPKFAVLYQLGIIIAEHQRTLLNKDVALVGKTNSSIYAAISKQLQRTSLYGHLSDVIGGNIKLEGLLKNDLPEAMTENFDDQILSFISTSKELGVSPILMTFAVSHNTDNIQEMPFLTRTNFVKYNTYLSPNGWLVMVDRYNERLRAIAQKESVPLIDLEKRMSGEPEYFLDFVHFNEAGHQVVSDVIGDAFTGLTLQIGARDDI